MWKRLNILANLDIYQNDPTLLFITQLKAIIDEQMKNSPQTVERTRDIVQKQVMDLSQELAQHIRAQCTQVTHQECQGEVLSSLTFLMPPDMTPQVAFLLVFVLFYGFCFLLFVCILTLFLLFFFLYFFRILLFAFILILSCIFLYSCFSILLYMSVSIPSFFFTLFLSSSSS